MRFLWDFPEWKGTAHRYYIKRKQLRKEYYWRQICESLEFRPVVLIKEWMHNVPGNVSQNTNVYPLPKFWSFSLLYTVVAYQYLSFSSFLVKTLKFYSRQQSTYQKDCIACPLLCHYEWSIRYKQVFWRTSGKVP